MSNMTHPAVQVVQETLELWDGTHNWPNRAMLIVARLIDMGHLQGTVQSLVPLALEQDDTPKAREPATPVEQELASVAAERDLAIAAGIERAVQWHWGAAHAAGSKAAALYLHEHCAEMLGKLSAKESEE
jgi:hypothetical protein